MKKAKTALLEQLITEELTLVLQEVGFMNKLKKLAAGAALAGSMAGASPALADKPAATAASQQQDASVSDKYEKDIIAQVALGSLQMYEKVAKEKGQKLDFDTVHALTLAQRALWLEAQNKSPGTFNEKKSLDRLAKKFYNLAIDLSKKYLQEKDQSYVAHLFDLGNPKNYNFEKTEF